MEDLEKLEQVYKILDKALRDIEDIGSLSDYDLDNEVEDMFVTIESLQTDIRGLIQDMENKR